MTIVLLRLPGVLRRTQRSRSSHYQDIQDGLMVSPVRIGTRAMAYPEHEIDAILAARLRLSFDDEIRALVRDLIAARQQA